MRQRGLRPVQYWVRDTRSPQVRERLARACDAINEADRRDGTMEWVESIGIFDEDEG